jgi:hypothetical protein
MSTPTLPEALRTRRAELGDIGQEAASVSMGLEKNQVHRWEKGAIPDPESVPALMKFLGVSQDQLGAIILETRMRKVRIERL